MHTENDDGEGKFDWLFWREDMKERGIKAHLKRGAVNEPVQEKSFRLLDKTLAEGDLVAVCEVPTPSPPIFKVKSKFNKGGNPVPWYELVPV